MNELLQQQLEEEKARCFYLISSLNTLALNTTGCKGYFELSTFRRVTTSKSTIETLSVCLQFYQTRSIYKEEQHCVFRVQRTYIKQDYVAQIDYWKFIFSEILRAIVLYKRTPPKFIDNGGKILSIKPLWDYITEGLTKED